MTLANPAAEALATRHRFKAVELLPWLIALAAYFVFPDYTALGTQVLILVLFALSLDLVLGYAGIITLGHAAFFGAGAYTAGLLASELGWREPLTGLAAAALVAGAVGLVSGWVLLRTHGLTLLMLTLATMTLLHELANEREDLTGGFDGLPVTIDPVLGVFAFNPLTYGVQYLYTLAVLLAVFLVVRRIVYSPFGQGLTGIRESIIRMHAVGTPVRRRLVTAYTISAAIAGIAGGLFAQANAYITLDVLSLDRAATVLIVLILGGRGRIYGAFLGAAVYLILEDELAKEFPEFWQFGLGLMLVLIALFAREGLMGLIAAALRRLKRGVAR
jgi:branched-chain amino acid transport system permease protein